MHKAWVAFYAFDFAIRLMRRGLIHDNSKLSPDELKDFVKYVHKLKRSTYGSEEYKATLKKIESIIQHYTRNRHHPEYFSQDDPRIERMNLVDLVEMFCDWRAAVRRHANGDILKSIEINQKRYKIPEELSSVFRNSISTREHRRHEQLQKM